MKWVKTKEGFEMERVPTKILIKGTQVVARVEGNSRDKSVLRSKGLVEGSILEKRG